MAKFGGRSRLLPLPASRAWTAKRTKAGGRAHADAQCRIRPLLTDHMHTLRPLPQGDTDFPTRWQTIKSTFSQRIPPTEPRSPSRHAKSQRGIWQRSYWEHAIGNDHGDATHMDYCH